MIGVLLAAGRSRRLGTITDELPKTLLPVSGETPILDIIVRNLRSVDVTEIVIVTGYHAELIDARVPILQSRFGVSIRTIYNDTYLDWNNCYSLWLARETFGEGVFVVNADTLHPPSVEQVLVKHRGPDVLLAVDDVKTLGEEEMKVLLDADGYATRIHKAIPPTEADGEHIGVSIVEPRAAAAITECLEATWRRDPTLYFEDGYQEFIDRGGTIGSAPIGAVRWIEVDNAEDYTRAAQIGAEYGAIDPAR